MNEQSIGFNNTNAKLNLKTEYDGHRTPECVLIYYTINKYSLGITLGILRCLKCVRSPKINGNCTMIKH